MDNGANVHEMERTRRSVQLKNQNAYRSPNMGLHTADNSITNQFKWQTNPKICTFEVSTPYHIVKMLQPNKIEVTLTQQTCPTKGNHGGNIEDLAFLVIFIST
jgi:hypothetical protein